MVGCLHNDGDEFFLFAFVDAAGDNGDPKGCRNADSWVADEAGTVDARTA